MLSVNSNRLIFYQNFLCLDSCYTYQYTGRSLSFEQDAMNMWFPYTPPDYTDYDSDNETIESNNTMDGNSTLDVESENNPTTETSTLNANETDKTSSDVDDNSDSKDGEALTRRFFYLYYTTSDIREVSSNTLVDFANFISSVGGNLGLFLGFSFLGMLLPLYDWAEQLHRNRMKKA